MMLVVGVEEPERLAGHVVENGIVVRSAEADGKGETMQLLARLLPAKDHARLTGIVLSMRGGSFSHVRSAAAVVNTLGFALGVPVLGVRRAISLERSRLRALESRLRRLRSTSTAHPAYRGAPNITIGRK